MSEQLALTALLPWISSAADSHAKTYPLPGKERGLPVLAPVSGPNIGESFASYDRGSLSWKTSQRSLLGGWVTFSETWPRSGMMRSGIVYELPTLAPHTEETASSLWPTPNVCGNYNRKGASPTSGDGLATAVKVWPTPTSRDWKDGANPSPEAPTNGLLGRAAPRAPTTTTSGALNPDWVESLMGFPDGWTDGLPPPQEAQYEWEAPRVCAPSVNRSVRLKAQGNAVVPQVAERVGWLVKDIAKRNGIAI